MTPQSGLPKPVDELIADLQSVFLPHEEILLAYLYGSYVKGPWTLQSDIDIGLFITDDAGKDPWYPLKIQEEITACVPSNHPFDVHILNHAGAKFCYEVIFQTPKILVRDESLRVEFETRTLIEWYDMRPTFENYQRELAEALRH
ncbi:MAG TPA: nucleotidyltransferase domain-containing protein [Candidatus Lokiarchaeia archaeon]|nr:nucleotidyltransferase domain-containing protein [Candidatus Lokiarchaeia archaeon]